MSTRIVDVPPPAAGGMSAGYEVIDPSIPPFAKRHWRMPWSRIEPINVAPLVIGFSGSFAGGFVAEYANFQALKYKDSTQGLPKEQRCFFAGHWHVWNDVRAQMGPGRMLLNKLVEILVDALRAGES